MFGKGYSNQRVSGFSFLKGKKFRVAMLILAIPALLLAAKLIPLEIESKSTDMAGLRDAVIGGFVDIVQAELAGQGPNYLTFVLVPNGFITSEEHLCDVEFISKGNGTMIKAVPYDIINGDRVEVADFGVRKGVFLMIEGAAQEMDYEIEMGGMMDGFGGF